MPSLLDREAAATASHRADCIKRDSKALGVSSCLSLTPASNTGLIPQNGFETSIDTVTVVFRKIATGKGAMDIKALLESTFSEKIDFDVNRPTFMMRHWDGSSSASLRGTMLHWKAPKEYGYGALRVHLPGKALAGVPSSDITAFFKYMHEVYQADCTRLDIAADDYGVRDYLLDVEAAALQKNYVGVRSHRVITSGGLGAPDGKTIYFGSKASDMQLRVYDKAVESNGVKQCIRWELQLRRCKAYAVFEKLLSLPSEEPGDLSSLIGGYISGAVRFCDRSSKAKDLSRCPDLVWWQRVRALLGSSVKIAVTKKEPLMTNKIGWLCKSVMPSLAAVQVYLGEEEFYGFLGEEIEEKRAVLSHLNKAMIDMAILERERDLKSACREVPAKDLTACDNIAQVSIPGIDCS